MTAQQWQPVVLSLGANLGDREQVLQSAVEVICLSDQVRGVAVSAGYETAPVGGPEQPDYLNAVLIVETTLAPLELLKVTQQIELDHDRVREVRWGPRTLDIDIIDFAGRSSDDPTLTLPHPRAHERAFVLLPWLAVDPDAELAGREELTAILSEIPISQTVQVRGDFTLRLPDRPTLES